MMRNKTVELTVAQLLLYAYLKLYLKNYFGKLNLLLLCSQPRRDAVTWKYLATA